MKFTHGLCLRAYRPALQVVEPACGSCSAYPTNVLPAAISSEPRFGALNEWSQPSSVTPWVLPENNAM